MRTASGKAVTARSRLASRGGQGGCIVHRRCGSRCVAEPDSVDSWLQRGKKPSSADAGVYGTGRQIHQTSQSFRHGRTAGAIHKTNDNDFQEAAVNIPSPQLSTIAIESTNSVAEIRLNRAERSNAMNEAMWQELRTSFNCADATPAVRVVILGTSAPASIWRCARSVCRSLPTDPAARSGECLSQSRDAGVAALRSGHAACADLDRRVAAALAQPMARRNSLRS